MQRKKWNKKADNTNVIQKINWKTQTNQKDDVQDNVRIK